MRALLLLILLMLSGIHGWAQETVSRTLVSEEKLIFSVRRYGLTDGLPARQINAVAQDDRDFIWLATPSGLVRFDGQQFTAYTRNEGLSSDAVATVLRAHDGLLWVLHTNGSLDILDPRTGLATPYSVHFSGALPEGCEGEITGIAASDEGDIVYGQQGHLVRYGPEGFTRVPVACSGALEPRQVTADGDVWCICHSGLATLSTLELYYISFGGAWKADAAPTIVRTAGIADVSRAGHDRSESGAPEVPGVYVFRSQDKCWSSSWVPSAGEGTEQSRKVPCAGYRAMLGNLRRPLSEDLWLVDATVRRMKAGDDPLHAPVLFDLADVHPEAGLQVNDVLRDRAGNIWLADEFGLFKVMIHADRFQRFLYDVALEGVPGKRVRGMAEDQGRLHVNTDGEGYWVLDANTGDVLRNDLFHGYRVPLMRDGKGGIWRGFYNDVYHENAVGKIDRVIRSPPGTGSLWSLMDLGGGRLLLGCQQGLQTNDSVDSTRTLSHPGHRELEQASVWHLGTDSKGRILACTSTGLYELDREGQVVQRWWSGVDRTTDAAHYIQADDIRHFHEDASGIFWLSTATRGLVRWDPESGASRTIGHREGLPSGSIHAAYADEQGLLWLPTDNGLARYDPASDQVNVFTTADGITHNEFNRIAHTHGESGRLYFGGLNGITAFDPADFHSTSSSTPAPLVITAVQVQGSEQAGASDHTLAVMDGQPVVMHPSDRFFTVDMMLLSYDEPAQIRYAWRIDGIDTEWNIQRDPHLRFTSLPYGGHVLRIKAMDADGRWTPQELTIPITMLKPYYLRWWFIVGCILLIAGGVYAGVRYRLRQLRQVIQVRDRIALDLHDEVGSNLSSIVLFSTAVGTGATGLTPQTEAMLKRITDNSTRAMESMNDIVWSVNSNYDSMEDLVDRMRAFAQPLCDAAEIELHMEIGERLLTRKVGMEERKSIYLIFKEAVNNAVKHGRCTRINVSLEMKDEGIQLVVADNGVGMAEGTVQHVSLGGNGLGNMRRRASEMGGKVEVRSSVEGGTVVVFRSKGSGE